MSEMTDMQTYLAAVRSALRGLPARERNQTVVELESNLRSDVDRRGGNPAAVRAALADLGSPEEYAAAVREALLGQSDSAEPQGRILGMPYEFRVPTASRVMERLWNPADPRIIMPRTWGIGWTFNFGAIAVRLGLVRPDDVEVRPFENLSGRAISVAVAVPLAIGSIAVGLALAFWSRLPAQVPTHFNGAGVADGWGAKSVTLGLLLAVAAGAPVLVLAWLRFRRASRGSVAIASVLLALFSLLASMILGYTIANAVYGVAGWWISLLIIGCLVLPGVMFYVLARASLIQEWRAASEPRATEPREGAR